VFWKKRLQSVENKEEEREKERQESSLRGSGYIRGGKRLEVKEIREVEEAEDWKRRAGLR
jgi:hypothetical protein